MEVWPHYGAAVLWVGARHLPFGLAAIERVSLHEFPETDGHRAARTAVGVSLRQGRVSRTLWFTTADGRGERIYLDLLLLLRRNPVPLPGGTAAPPRHPG
jgi:hypothetical protein